MADTSTQWSPWDLVGPGISALGSVYSGSAAAGGYNAARGTLQNAVNASGAYLSPYANGGASATSAYENLLGLGGVAPNFDAFTNSPGYQFQKQQGEQALNRAALAQGNGFSTTTLAGLDKYNSGLASTQYQQYLQNLFGLIQTGAGAASAAGSQGITGASAVGNAQVGSAMANNSGVNGALVVAQKLPWQSIGNYFSSPDTSGIGSSANSTAGDFIDNYNSNFNVPSLYGTPDSSGVTTYFGN